MTRLSRWPSLLILLVLLAWLPAHVPGWIDSSGESGFSLGELVRDVSDPFVLLLAIGAALLAGGWRGSLGGAAFLLRGDLGRGDAASNATPSPGHVAASRALAAGGRGLLWGACALNTLYLVSFYLAAPSSGGLLGPGHIDFVKAGALVAIVAGAFLLIPAGEAIAALTGRPVTRATRAARAVDGLATVGLLACTLTLLLWVFVYRVQVIGQESPGSPFLRPSAGAIDLPFVIWSFAVVCIVVALAHLAALHPVTPAGQRLVHLGRTSLAAGVLVAILVGLGGLMHIAATGGQANPAELTDVAGRMLVPALVGGLVGACLRLRPAAGAWRGRPARDGASVA